MPVWSLRTSLEEEVEEAAAAAAEEGVRALHRPPLAASAHGFPIREGLAG